ncbi:hypothetical protein CR513_13732, partial [Mucuna pruriens]
MPFIPRAQLVDSFVKLIMVVSPFTMHQAPWALHFTLPTSSYNYDNQYTLHPRVTPFTPLFFEINLFTLYGEIFYDVINNRVIIAKGVTTMTSTFKNPNTYMCVTKLVRVAEE